MDNKRMLVGMAFVLMLVLGYQAFLVKFVYPRHPEWDTTGKSQQTQAVPAPAPTPPPAPAPTTGPTTQLANSSIPSMGPATVPSNLLHVFSQTGNSQQTIIGSKLSKDKTYCLGLDLTPAGAGIDSVTLNQYGAVNDPKHIYTFEQPYSNRDDTRVLSTQKIIVNGQAIDAADVNWSLESSAPDRATYGIYIDSGTAHQLHITKSFLVDPIQSAGGGYEVKVGYHVENLSGQAQAVRVAFQGPTQPPREVERGADRQIVSGYDKSNSLVDFQHHGIEEYKKDAASRDLLKSDKGYKFLWAGATSAYFNAIVLADIPDSIDKADATALNVDSDPSEREVAINFETGDFKIPAGKSAEIPFHVYFGPKERRLLEDGFYSNYPRFYSDTILASTSCGFMAFPWLIDGLVDLLRFFHLFLFDWGLSIIALVILVRLCLHPITKASQVSMMKMTKMGPEIERLKKKFGDDKDAFAKAQMQLYKEVGFTPILGCLPMFLQMPIWIALYSALQGEIALRQAPFLWGFTWIHDLARPDRLWAFDAHAFTLPLIGKITSLNLLPLVLAVVYFLQQKYTPKPPTTNPQQEQQQKMMKYMSLLFPIFLYTYPSGLNLYIATSSTIGILESKRIRDHIKQRQEAEKSDKVIVDAKPTRAGKQNKKDELRNDADAKKAAKPGGLAGWWANLQAKAEEIRREAERANKKL